MTSNWGAFRSDFSLFIKKYSGPLNNMGLNCVGPPICGIFSIDIQVAFGISRFHIVDSTNCGLKIVFAIGGWESVDEEG